MDGGDLKSSVDTINRLSQAERSDKTIEELTAAFRYLRNICAEGRDVQNKITSDENVLNSTYNILNDIINSAIYTDSSSLCLLVGLQFVANLLVSNYDIQTLIWEDYRNLLNSCLRFNSPKVQNCVAMILYNIFLGHSDCMEIDKNLFEDVIALTTNESLSEFPLYLLQLFIKKNQYIQEIYDTLKSDSKLIIIEVIQDLIRDDNVNLHTDLISFFVNKFLKYSDVILNILQSLEYPFEAIEAVKVLELITSISSGNEGGLHILQSQKSLLINCVMLLKNVHTISKEDDNNFSMIQKISELNVIEKNKNVQEHPYFGFKSSLIRLIGNLCWKNVDNQNKVRELDAIPVLLDCCNIDGRNPFITQWTILAIRNICDNNVDNQKFIASMPRTGTVDVEKLEKMGILLNKDKDGSTVSICPLELKN